MLPGPFSPPPVVSSSSFPLLCIQTQRKNHSLLSPTLAKKIASDSLGRTKLYVLMADAGFHCFAPDWVGFGFSEKPQPGYGFNYTEKEFHEEFDKMLVVLNISSPFALVVQGFIVGSYGLTWALKNSDKISELVILNSPLTVSSRLPGLFQQLRIPLFGEFTCQNAVMAERFIEAGSSPPSSLPASPTPPGATSKQGNWLAWLTDGRS